MRKYSRKEVVMKNLSDYVKKNIEMSLSDFLNGYLTIWFMFILIT